MLASVARTALTCLRQLNIYFLHGIQAEEAKTNINVNARTRKMIFTNLNLY